MNYFEIFIYYFMKKIKSIIVENENSFYIIIIVFSVRINLKGWIAENGNQKKSSNYRTCEYSNHYSSI